MQGQFYSNKSEEFVCLFQSQAISSCEHPQGSGFLRARPFVLPPQGQLCSNFGEVHAGYISVAGTDMISTGYQYQDLLSPCMILCMHTLKSLNFHLFYWVFLCQKRFFLQILVSVFLNDNQECSK